MAINIYTIQPVATFPSRNAVNEKPGSLQAAKNCLAALRNAADSLAPRDEERAQVFVIARKEFDFAHASFTDATNAYVSAMADVMTRFMGNMTQIQKDQTHESDAFTEMAQNIATQVAKEWAQYNEQQSEASSSSWLSIVIDVLVIVIAVVSEDPALFAMGTYSLISHATGKDPLESAFEKLTGSKIAGEFLAGLVEAAACCCVEGIADKLAQNLCKTAAEQVAKEAGEQVAKTIAQKLVSFLRNILGNLSMTLMMSTFWQDAFEGMGMSSKDAMWMGLFVGILSCAGGGLLKEDSLLKDILQRGLQNRFGQTGLKVMRGLVVAANLTRNGFQIAQGVETIREGEALEVAAGILRQIGVTQGTYTLINGLCDMFNEAMHMTQSTMNTVIQDYTAFNQTLPSFARMMDINHQQAV